MREERPFMNAPAASASASEDDEASDPFEDILLPGALELVARLARSFAPRIGTLLAEREVRYRAWRAGAPLGFRDETTSVRDGDWRILPIPADLTRRIVEITGPVDRKMIINALNSGADVFMADFEDATAPTWRNVVQGQRNLRDAVRRTITYTDPASGTVFVSGHAVGNATRTVLGIYDPTLTEAEIEVTDGTTKRFYEFGVFDDRRLLGTMKVTTGTTTSDAYIATGARLLYKSELANRVIGQGAGTVGPAQTMPEQRAE